MDRRNGISRRQWLLTGAAGGLAALTGCGRRETAAVATPTPVAGRLPARPRNVIFLVSDGMSTGVPSLADPLSRLVRGRGTHWRALMEDRSATHGLLDSRSANSLVTDSSAAASAWGSGQRVNNGVLNVLPSGTPLTPIARILHDAGRRVGLVTTDNIVGGTPAGFACVAESRHAYEELAPQYLDVVDVLLGGGRETFDPLARKDHLDVAGQYRAHGYAYRFDRGTLLSGHSAPKLLGLFAQAVMPYTIDHMHSAELRETTPTLAEMTEVALRSLSDGGEGFFVMIEAARVDHAAHFNDIAATLWDQLAFDDALGVALNFARERDDTLVVVTSDHGNSNPGLNGMGSGYKSSDETFANLAGTRASFGELQAAAKKAGPGGDLAGVIKNLVGLDLNADELAVVTTALLEEKGAADVNGQEDRWTSTLGQVFGNHHGVQWVGRTHTADHVLLTATGPGAADFTGLHSHPEVFGLVLDQFGLSFRNPADAPKDAASAPAA